MSNNDQSSGISTPPDLTKYIVKQEDHYSNCGGFGDVWRCWYNESEGVRKEVAVKAFRFRFTMDEDDAGQWSAKKMDIRRELGIWKRLNHENIVPFLGIAYGFGMSGALSLVSLWMPNDTLHRFLAKHHHNSLSVARRLQLLLDIANGLKYLHSFHIRPIIHGDLNSNNVLIDANYNARLTDFGYASLVGSTPEALRYLQMSTRRPGAFRWAAPELVIPREAFNRTIKSDIYSFGSISLQMLSGKQPWSEIKEDACVVLLLAQGLNPGRPEHHKISDQHWNFIQQCWSSVPTERPSAEGVISSIRLFLSTPEPCSTSSSDQYGLMVVLDELSLDHLDLFPNDSSALSFGLDKIDEINRSVDYQGDRGGALPNYLPTATSTDPPTLLSTGCSTDSALADLSLLLSIPPAASPIPLLYHAPPLEPFILPSDTDVPSNPSSPSERFYTPPCSPITPYADSNASSSPDLSKSANGVRYSPYPVRASLGNPPYCQWMNEDGITCGEFITPVNISTHLAEHHGIRNMPAKALLTCTWAGCDRRAVTRMNLVRHVREVHLRVGRMIPHHEPVSVSH